MSRCTGGSIARQIDKLANGNMPYHRHAEFTNRVGWGAGGLSAFLFSKGFDSSLGWEFKLFFFRLQICHQVVRKIVLHIVWLAYPLLILLLSLLL